ncbi:hypothetical protein EGK59_17015 [Acinetobacter soli]|nr:hypothetical protein EGK59_17015 [Acinetobacter soli]
MISNVSQNCKPLNFFVRHRHQHIKPSAKEIAKVHILKADIFTLEKPDISILELHFCLRIRCIMLILENLNFL